MIIAVDTHCILPGRVGGIENYTLGLIETLKLAGSPASRLLLLTRPENHDLFAGRGEAVLIDRPTGNWSDHPPEALAAFQRRKLDILSAGRVELVHFPGNTINPLDLNWPAVLNLHDLQHRHFPQYFTAHEIAQRERWWVGSARRADALLAASSYVRDDLHAQLGIEKTKVFVTPDAFESAFGMPLPSQRLDEIRRRFALPRTFFIYPAAAWAHKNHARLIQAFSAANLPDAQLLLTGGGQEDAPWRQEISRLRLEQSVRLLGRVATEDLAGLYQLATALIFPSEHEAWSIPVMEAMACGCPAASSNVTSLPEEIGDAGILFDPRDVAAMADAMRSLAGDAALRKTLSARGRARVERFAPRHSLEVLSAAYRHALAAHAARKAA